MNYLLENGFVFLDNKEIVNKTIAIINGVIKLSNFKNYSIDHYIDCKNKLITPTFIDSHVHTRIPGQEYKENLSTFTNSCLAGGVTQVIAMSNVLPRPETAKLWDFCSQKLENKKVKIYQTAAATNFSKKMPVNVAELSQKTKFFTDDGYSIMNFDIMRLLLPKIKKSNAILLLHEEDYSTKNGPTYPCNYAIKHHLGFYDTHREVNLVERDIKLNQSINAHIHVQHISTYQTLSEINLARNYGMNITCEVCPHHLILSTDSIVSDDGNFKMNPPLPTPHSQKMLITGLNTNMIDIIVSDHAPHSKHEKDKGLCQSHHGIIGVQHMFSLLYTHLVKTGKVKLLTILQKITNSPSMLFLNKKWQISHNHKININIIDLNRHQKITPQTIYSLSKNTPFLHNHIYGIVVMIIQDQKIIWKIDEQ